MKEGLLATVAAAAALPAGAAAAPAPPAPAPVIVSTAPAASAPDQAAITAAVKLERERIAAIDGLAVAGFEDLARKAKDEGTAPGEFAIALLGGIKASGRLDAVEALKAAAATVPDLAAAPSPAGGASASGTAGLTGEAKWKADFAASEKLQAEYLTEAGYVATMRREAMKAA